MVAPHNKCGKLVGNSTASGADYMSRDESFSRDPGTSEKHTNYQVCDYMEKSQPVLAEIAANRAEIFLCNRVHQDSPVGRAKDF